jgi:Uma2 family endonuclease
MGARAHPAHESADDIVYPESDGQPMADNTLQYDWIVMLKENLDVALPDDFVAADLLWYPVRGEVRTRMAPDVLVALGRPKGYRGSYLQWREEGVAPQVVFEVLSPGNKPDEMQRKLAFYNRHGVQEYYVVDPDVQVLEAFARESGMLVPVELGDSFTSPLLGVRFLRQSEQLRVFRPDGEPFRGFAEICAQRDAAAAERDALVVRLDAAAAERDAAAAKAERLAERLRALGIDPDEG